MKLRDRLNTSWRAQHRAQHSSRQDTQPAPPIPDLPGICRDAPDWIDTPEKLGALITQLRNHGSFALDTEFIGETSYRPRLCLIQVATENQIALIDPLCANMDTAPLWDVFADPAITKLVHAGRQELLFAFQISGKAPTNTLDTQVLAAFGGWPWSMGHGRMVETLLDTDVGKCAKVSAWDMRPLSARQKHYAANDVRFLPACYQKIRASLGDNQSIAEEACEAECYSASQPTDNPVLRLKIGPKHRVGKAVRGALHALTYWRETTAVKEDLPPRLVAPDDALLELAKQSGGNPDFHTIARLPSPVVEMYGDEMLKVAREGRLTPPPFNPPKRLSEKQGIRAKARSDAWWEALEKHCQTRFIDPNVVTSRKELLRLAQADINNFCADERTFRILEQPWRRELLEQAYGDILPQLPSSSRDSTSC